MFNKIIKISCFNESLTNYWSLNNNLYDAVGRAHLLTTGSNYKFVENRFGEPKSAIYLNKSYLQIPAGVYFSGDFTFTAWIFIDSLQFFARFFDFGDSTTNDNVLFYMESTTGSLTAMINNKQSVSTFIGPTKTKLELKKWYQITFVLKKSTGYIYLNEAQIAAGQLNRPRNIFRKSNWFGKSNWPSNENIDAIFDEIKIYKSALNSNDIQKLYTNSGLILKAKAKEIIQIIFIIGYFLI